MSSLVFSRGFFFLVTNDIIYHGKPGWAWIFILEGLATVLVAIASFWVLQDFPDNAKFLTEAESG